MRRTLALLLFLVPALTVLADTPEEPRAITHEDVWTMLRLGSPVVDPSGQLAIVSVSKPAYDKDDETSDLWLLRIDGSSSPRQLTATKESEGDVAWRPDGGAIAFTTKRGEDESKQVYPG